MYKKETKKESTSEISKTKVLRAKGESFRMRPYDDQEPAIDAMVEMLISKRKTGEPVPQKADACRELLDAGIKAKEQEIAEFL